MTKIAVPLTVLATVLVCWLPAAPAQAQNTYTAVSAAAGLPKAGSCGSIHSPCRTLQAAFTVTNTGGEIDVLDPGDYGPLTITHAISIQGHGWATVTAPSGGTAIIVNAGIGDNINIRGVLLDGAITGNTGIQFNSGATLNIQDSTIRNFYGSKSAVGIIYSPSNNSQLFVSNTLVSDSSYGIIINNEGVGIPYAVLDNVAIENNPITGVSVANAYLMVRNSTFADNGIGLNAGLYSIIRITRSTITGNSTGWATYYGSVLSYGDNNIDNNGAGNGAPLSIPYK